MSSSTCTLAAAAKSCRSLKVRQWRRPSRPTRRYVPTSLRLPYFSSVAGEDLLHTVEVLLDVRNEDRAVEHVIGNALGDLALAAAADGARLVAEGAVADRADQPPTRRAGVALDPHLVARRGHIHLTGK